MNINSIGENENQLFQQNVLLLLSSDSIFSKVLNIHLYPPPSLANIIQPTNSTQIKRFISSGFHPLLSFA